jgi:hypothetical protein
VKSLPHRAAVPMLLVTKLLVERRLFLTLRVFAPRPPTEVEVMTVTNFCR